MKRAAAGSPLAFGADHGQRSDLGRMASSGMNLPRS